MRRRSTSPSPARLRRAIGAAAFTLAVVATGFLAERSWAGRAARGGGERVPPTGSDTSPDAGGVAQARVAGRTAPRPGAENPAASGVVPLRVCADPNNLPFSNEAEEGFENRIAEIVAGELRRPLAYTWRAQRRGFIRNTLNAHVCDVVIGIASSVDMLLTTRPYYRSTYVFVTRKGGPHVTTFDDPRLRRLRIGVQLIGDDGANSPPVHALTKRGIIGNLVGFTVYGDYSTPNPPARIVDAVAADHVDIAVVWGPLAGWAAQHARTPLVLEPVTPQIDLPFLPQVYDISMGVRRTDVALRDSLEAVIARRRGSIDSVLAAYGVPRVGTGKAQVAGR